MDNSTTGDVTYTAGMVTDPLQDFARSSKGAEVGITVETTTSLAGLQQDANKSSKASLAAGVTVLVIVLIAGIVGFIFFIKRRKSKRTNPVVENAKNRTDRRPDSRTTWNEIELNSVRSSDVSTVVDYDVVERGMEMQPSIPFAVSSVSMYDEDSADEEFHPHKPSVGGSMSVNAIQLQESEIYDTPTLTRNTDPSLNELRKKQSEEKTAVVFDKTTKSFKVEENVTEETDPTRFQSYYNVENELEKKFKTEHPYSDESKTSKKVHGGYELARIIPGEDINDSAEGVELPTSGKVNNKETGNSEDGSDSESAQPESDELYMNHATLSRNKTSETNIATEENSEITVDNLSKTSGKPAVLNGTDTQSIARKPAKAPIPQPRISKRESSNTVEMPNNSSSHSNFTTEIDNQGASSGTQENYVEYDPATSDSVESDYDTVDHIYDCPKNNKEIGERDEDTESKID